MTILLVCPVDNIVQGLWKNFLPFLTAFLEIISKFLSKTYEDYQMQGKVTKPFAKFVFSSP